MPTTPESLTKSLVTDFAKLLVNANDYNVLIKVGGGESSNIACIKAHSCILRARSPYFYSALSTKWRKLELDDNDRNCMVFEKPNISPDVFQIILSYIYSGTISLENQLAAFILDILAAANELMLQELENFVINYFIKYHSNWIKNNPIQLMHHAVFKLESCQNIQQLCLNNICKNPDQLFSSLTFKSIHESTLIQIIKRDDLRMNEINLLDYLIQWGINNTPSLNNTIADTAATDFLNSVSPSCSNWSQNEFNALELTLKNCLAYIRFDNINRNELSSFQQLIHLEKFLEKFFEKYLFEENLVDSKIINMSHAILISDWIDNIDNLPNRKQIYHLLEDSKLSRINPKNSSMAIFCADVRGPCFGGKDLCMSNMSSLNKGCSTKYTYYESDIFKSSKFDVVDYEVFQVVRKKVKINES
ncbi:3945_t:CDS:2 [Entrophospora sp. SA101]|nr:3943_t:CDS:2 [Entrophospora sp. SA101]CAJ0643896.1 3945_t:CDS:2 [Entrophospora sp. SA101]